MIEIKKLTPEKQALMRLLMSTFEEATKKHKLTRNEIIEILSSFVAHFIVDVLHTGDGKDQDERIASNLNHIINTTKVVRDMKDPSQTAPPSELH